jgi:hypothetical protein
VKDQSAAFGDLEKLLALYVKQGYLLRIKETNEEENTYLWGPRSKIEISSKDLARFMASVSVKVNAWGVSRLLTIAVFMTIVLWF